jgi:hypothetical protein
VPDEYFKLDVHVNDHPKVIGLSDAAFRVWVASMADANRRMTDGFIARPVARRFHDCRWDDEEDTPEAHAEELVEAGLWELADGGWQVHNFAQHNRTREERLADRDAKREGNRQRQQRYRERHKPSSGDPNANVTRVTERDETLGNAGDEELRNATSRDVTHIAEQSRTEESTEEKPFVGDDAADGEANASGVASRLLEVNVNPQPQPLDGLQVEGRRDVRETTLVEQARPVAADIERVFETWKTSTGKHKARLDNRRRAKIIAALKAYQLEDVLAAIQGWKRSPHHRGENERHTVYNDLELLLRDAAHIERFRDLHNGDGPALVRARVPRPGAGHDELASYQTTGRVAL